MYFDKFPFLRYLDTDGRKKIVTDVLRRVDVDTIGKKESTYFLNYDLRDGDTPESISDRLYETPDLYWLVLLINDFLNPYYDGPLDSVSLENYSKKKYEGKYFYLVNTGSTLEPTGLTFARNETIYSSTTNKDDYGTTQENYTIRARILEHEPTLARVLVDGGEHSYFAEGGLIGKIEGSNIKQAQIQKIEDGVFGLHHFGTGTGDRINPLSATDGTPLGLTASSGDFASTPPSFWQTRIGKYMGLSGSSRQDAISNFVYEINENEEKRSISLIHPDRVGDVIAGFERLINQ